MRVIRMRLDDSTMVPPNIRFFEGNIQITFDGGLTWVDSPENDPRYGVQFLAPALTGEDAKCDAAYRMTEIIRAQVDAALDAATAVGLATAIVGIVTVLIPINPIVALVTALAALLLAIGAAVLDAAFDEERYQAIQCIFYNNISDNGQVNADQLEAILVDFEEQFAGSIAADVCVSVVFVMGQNGLSNAGSLTGGSGDCDDCPTEWCNLTDFTALAGDYIGFSNPAPGIWSLGVGWQSQYASGSGYAGVYNCVGVEWATPADFKTCTFVFNLTGTYSGAASGVYLQYKVDGVWYTWGSGSYDPSPGDDQQLNSPTFDDGALITGVRFIAQLDASSGSVDVTVTACQMRGFGDTPFTLGEVC